MTPPPVVKIHNFFFFRMNPSLINRLQKLKIEILYFIIVEMMSVDVGGLLFDWWLLVQYEKYQMLP